MSSQISEANFYTLLKGEIVAEGVGSSYDFEHLKTVCLAQKNPFSVAAAAATIQAPPGVVGAKLNQWEQAKILVKVKVSNRGLYLKRDGIDPKILAVYDQRKITARESMALMMPSD